MRITRFRKTHKDECSSNIGNFIAACWRSAEVRNNTVFVNFSRWLKLNYELVRAARLELAVRHLAPIMLPCTVETAEDKKKKRKGNVNRFWKFQNRFAYTYLNIGAKKKRLRISYESLKDKLSWAYELMFRTYIIYQANIELNVHCAIRIMDTCYCSNLN